MKSYELKPTPENLEFAFANNLIGRNESLFDFLEFLNNIEDDCSIALEGYWGSGKTFFVKQMEMIIKAINPFIETNKDLYKIIQHNAKMYIKNYNSDKMISQVPIYYDAWLYDNESDPILSLVYSILETFNSELIFKEINFNGDAIRESLNNILSSLHINLEIPKLLNSNDWLSDIKNSRDIHSTIEEFLNQLLEERGDRLVVFVDELDRCTPKYAVKLLERIKHYFNNDRITFVFSVNLEQLQHTIKSFYGNNFEASRYLDRFFDLRLSLPAPNKGAFYDMIEFNADENNYDGLINKTIIDNFDLEFREILKYARILKLVNIQSINRLLKLSYINHFSNEFISAIMIPIMIALKITNVGDYKAFISGNRSDIFVNIYSSNSIFEAMFHRILKSNEIFEGNYNRKVDDKKEIDFISFLKEIFSFVFMETTEPFYKVEKIIINRNVKKYILEKISLINKSLNLDKDSSVYN